MTIKLSEEAVSAMINDAIESYPNECCGFVFGNEFGSERIIKKIQVVNNAKEGDKRRRFEISPLDYLKAERYAEEQNFSLLGVYHSHPDHLPIPSEHDRIAAQPWLSYLILSVKNADFAGLRSWRLNDDQQFEEETIKDAQYILNISSWQQ